MPKPPTLASLYNPTATRLARIGTLPEVDPQQNYRQSMSPRKRIPLELLRVASRVTPVARAIRRVQRSVRMMPWIIRPPKEDAKKPESLKIVEDLTRALKRPNKALGQNTYQKFVSAALKDLLILNYAAIQRMPDEEKRFCLWAVDGSCIHHNPHWNEDDPSDARYHYIDPRNIEPIHLADEDLFIIQMDSSTYELIPPSPVETAFPHVVAWLALHNFQHATTSKISAKYILDIGDVTQSELDAFRDYWEEHIEADGETPILGGKGAAKAVTLGATNDSELYLQYHEVLLQMIALCFDMGRRDMGLENFTYATAGVSADSSYQESILPVADTLIEHLNLEVIDYYQENFTIEYLDTQKSTEKEERESASGLYEKKLATRNESRMLAGLDPIGEPGDKFSDGMGLDGSMPPDPNAAPGAAPSEAPVPVAPGKQPAAIAPGKTPVVHIPGKATPAVASEVVPTNGASKNGASKNGAKEVAGFN